MSDMKLSVGGKLEDDAAAFVDAWRRTERGESVRERLLAHESRELPAKVMTGERYRLLKHLHACPEPSIALQDSSADKRAASAAFTRK